MATWGPREKVSGGAGVLDPDVTADAAGRVTVVWERRQRIKAVQRTARGAWGKPVTIGRGVSPQVVADGRGRVTVVWLGVERMALLSARRTVAGPWGRPVVIAGKGPFLVEGFELDVNRGGAVFVNWRASSNRSRAVYRPARGDWASPELAANGRGSVAAATIDAAGRVAVFFEVATDDLGHNRWRVARRLLDGTWSAGRFITPTEEDGEINTVTDAATAPAGAIVVLIVQEFSGGFPEIKRLRSVRRPVGGLWEAPVDVGEGAYGAQVEVDARGQATAAWGGGGHVLARDRAGRHPWGPVTTIEAGSSEGFVFPQLDVHSAGDAVVTWRRPLSGTGGLEVLRAAYRLQNGLWSAPESLASRPFHDAATGLPKGGAVVVWTYSSSDPGTPARRPLFARVLSPTP
jgi:hypothetical protein